MTKARLILVVPDDGSITREARTERRALYQAVADKIGAELLVAGFGTPQLLEVPLLTEAVTAASSCPGTLLTDVVEPSDFGRALRYALPLSLLGWGAIGGLVWLVRHLFAG